MTTFILVVVAFIAGSLLGTVYGRRFGAAALAKAEAELNLLKSL